MSQHLTLEEITIVADINTLRGRGTPGNSRWGVPPVSPNPDPVSKQKCHFHMRFQTWPLKSRPTWAETICQHYLDWNANILKFILEFANYSFFLIHLEWKRQMRSYTRSRSSLEPYPIADQNGQNL